MAVTYTCPECGIKLKPARPIPVGKKIKCPKCSTIFAPSARATAAAARPGKAAAKPAPAKKSEDDDWGDTNPYAVKQEEAAPKEEMDFINIRDRFEKSARGPAQKAVVRPANAMLALSIIQCLLCIGWFLYGLWPFVFVTDIGDPKDPKNLTSYARSGLGEDKADKGFTQADQVLHYWFMGGAVFSFLWYATCCVAAFKMHTLESIAWAWTGAVMTLLGVGILGLGIVVGIWAMVVLNNDEVKEGFAEQNPYK